MGFCTAEKSPSITLGAMVARCARSKDWCETSLGELQVAAIGTGKAPAFGQGELGEPANAGMCSAKEITHY